MREDIPRASGERREMMQQPRHHVLESWHLDLLVAQRPRSARSRTGRAQHVPARSNRRETRACGWRALGSRRLSPNTPVVQRSVASPNERRRERALHARRCGREAAGPGSRFPRASLRRRDEHAGVAFQPAMQGLVVRRRLRALCGIGFEVDERTNQTGEVVGTFTRDRRAHLGVASKLKVIEAALDRILNGLGNRHVVAGLVDRSQRFQIRATAT